MQSGYPQPCTIEIVKEYIYSPNHQQRIEIARLLAGIGTSTANVYLTEMLTDPLSEVQLVSAAALAKVGNKDAMGVLSSLRHHREWRVRQGVAEELAACDPDQSIELLMNIIKTDSDSDVKAAAYDSLGQIGKPELIPFLETAIGSEDVTTATARAAAALVSIGDPLQASEAAKLISRSHSVITRFRAACVLHKKGDDQGALVLKNLANHNNNAYVRTIASEALCTERRPTMPLLEELAKSGNAEGRVVAARYLEHMEDPKAVPELIRLAGRDQPPGVQIAAARSLARRSSAASKELADKTIETIAQLLSHAEFTIHDAVMRNLTFPVPDALQEYATAWRNDSSYQRRRFSAICFGHSNLPDDFSFLLDLCRDAIDLVRRTAVESLGNWPNKKAVIFLLERLERAQTDENWEERIAAAAGFDRMGANAVPFLLEQISSTSDDNQLSKELWVLNNLGDRREIRPILLARGLDQSSIWMQAADEAREEIDRRVEPFLVNGLRCPDTNVRKCAARALGATGSEIAVPPLIASLSDRDWDVRQAVSSALSHLGTMTLDKLHVALANGERNVRAAAASILGNVGNTRSISVLKNALTDQGRLVRGNAALALGRVRAPEAVPSLTMALKDQDAGVRNCAAWALAQIATPEALAAVEKWNSSRSTALNT